MKNLCSFVALVLYLSASAHAAVIITGILDGDLSGGTPKALELYIDGTEDLSNYTLQRSANGGAFGSNFSVTGIFTDEFVYLVGTQFDGPAQFESVFGTAGDFANVVPAGNISGNGDDAFRILDGSNNVVDQVWYENTSDEYKDSWMYRKDGTGIGNDGWVSGDWDRGGNGALDGLDAAGHEAAVPFGSYIIPEPATLILLGLGGVLSLNRRK